MKRIEAALNTQLISSAGGVDISYQNKKYTPVDGTPYIRPNFLPAQPEPWVVGAATNFHTGIYQVDLIYPAGVGQSGINNKADEIITAFNQATLLTYSGVNVYIKSSGRGNAQQNGNWYFMPVNIRWECYLPN